MPPDSRSQLTPPGDAQEGADSSIRLLDGRLRSWGLEVANRDEQNVYDAHKPLRDRGPRMLRCLVRRPVAPEIRLTVLCDDWE